MTGGRVLRVGIERPGLYSHGQRYECDLEGCGYVVEQHQNWGKPSEGDVPEFTIEVAYKTHDRNGVPVREGWRYALKWKEHGEEKSERSYGYDLKERALAAAKNKADKVAKTLRPVHVETYTPEL